MKKFLGFTVYHRDLYIRDHLYGGGRQLSRSEITVYYRRFIKGLHKTAIPSKQLLKKDIKLNWRDVPQKEFDILKEKLCEETLL